MADRYTRRNPDDDSFERPRSNNSSRSSYSQNRSGYPNQEGYNRSRVQVDRYSDDRPYDRYRSDAGYSSYHTRSAHDAYKQQRKGRGAAAVRGNSEESQYRDYGRYLNKPPKKRNLKAIAIFLVVIALIAGGVFLYSEFRVYSVNINGTTYEFQGKHTLASVVEDKYVEPTPGNLLAIDGTVYAEGEGSAFEAVVNGEPEPDHEYRLQGGEVIIINNGTDITEAINETTEKIPFETVEEGYGPIHAFEEGKEGSILVRTGALSGIEQREEVEAPQNAVWRNYYADTGGEKVIALTIDDGPWGDTTSQILDVLSQNNVKATFFTVGELIDQNDTGKNLVKRAFDEGHQVCTHTYTHASGSGQGVNLGYMTAEEQIAEVTKGLEAIERVTGQEASKVFRSPGGNYNAETRDILKPYISAEIGWTIDTVDWQRPGASYIVDQIVSNATSGGIILVHDGGGDRSQTVEALRQAIPILKEKGYRFVTMDELLEYPPSY